MNLAKLYEKGIPPVAGGSLDQTAWFNQAATFIWAEESRARAEAVGD